MRAGLPAIGRNQPVHHILVNFYLTLFDQLFAQASLEKLSALASFLLLQFVAQTCPLRLELGHVRGLVRNYFTYDLSIRHGHGPEDGSIRFVKSLADISRLS